MSCIFAAGKTLRDIAQPGSHALGVIREGRWCKCGYSDIKEKNIPEAFTGCSAAR